MKKLLLIHNIAKSLRTPIWRTSVNGCFWKRVHETEKKRLFIRNFYIFILYINETSENVCFYFMKETSENAFF